MVAIKRKAPRETIEGHNPKIEHVYVKLPGQEIKDITLNSDEYSAEHDEMKLSEVLRQNMVVSSSGLIVPLRYTDLHNHSVTGEVHDEALPSADDMWVFLRNGRNKTMAIAQQDSKTGEVQGYLILRKRKDTPSEGSKIGENAVVRRHELYRYQHLSAQNPRVAMDELSKKYNIQYRWVPAKGYELPSERTSQTGWRFVKKRSSLESSAVTVSVIGLLGATFFLSSNFTGNVINNSNSIISNWIGGVLFVVGIVGFFAYFRKR